MGNISEKIKAYILINIIGLFLNIIGSLLILIVYNIEFAKSAFMGYLVGTLVISTVIFLIT